MTASSPPGHPPDDCTLATGRWLAAPPAHVLAAFADPARLARWWGPAGFRNHFTTFEFRPGGRWVHTMEGPDGTRYPNEAVFEATGPERIAIRHTCAPHFLLTVTLAARDGGTWLDWQQAFEDAATCRAVAAVCTPANEQNLDRLDAVLAGRS